MMVYIMTDRLTVTGATYRYNCGDATSVSPPANDR